MPKWLRPNGDIIQCDDYVFWLDGYGWIPGAMMAYLALHKPELLDEYIKAIYKPAPVNYDDLIIK